MDIKLYNSKSDPTDINKDLTLFKEFTTPSHSYILGADKLHANFLNLKIENVNEIDLRRVVNYMVVTIDDVEERYFIDNIIYTNGLYSFSTRKDVLETHWDNIKNIPCIVGRASASYKTYLPDNKRLFSAYKKRGYLKIDSNPFDPNICDDKFYMITVGDGHHIYGT